MCCEKEDLSVTSRKQKTKSIFLRFFLGYQVKRERGLYGKERDHRMSLHVMDRHQRFVICFAQFFCLLEANIQAWIKSRSNSDGYPIDIIVSMGETGVLNHIV